MADEPLRQLDADGNPRLLPQALEKGASLATSDGDTTQYGPVRQENGRMLMKLEPAASVQYGQVSVGVSGSSEPLAGSSTPIDEGVVVKAFPGNTSQAYVGDSGVTTSNGFLLGPGEQVFLVVDDLATVHVDVDSGGDSVSFIAS